MKLELKVIADDTHEDQMALRRMLKAEDMAIALFEIHVNLWRHCESVEEYKRRIYEELEAWNINLEDLIE